MSKYRTAPAPSPDMPGGIPYIIVNDVAERFSFYGMRAILVIFMTQYLMTGNGALDTMSEEDATSWFHLFVSTAYFLPILGAILADAFLGKYRTIIILSLVYCAGHFSLFLDDTRIGLFLGLTLIAIGSGGIKPSVASNVGDQFGRSNQHLLSRAFSWYYMGINIGSSTSSLLTPWLLEHYGPSVAFGVPGLFMLTATITYWLGRHRFVHIPPAGRSYLQDITGPDGRRVVKRLLFIYVLVAAFWSLFDQQGSTWVLQAENMNRTVMGYELLPAQIQSANPFLILILIPTFTYLVYPAMGRCFEVTVRRRMCIGMFVAATPFLVTAWIEAQIQAGFVPHIGWQLLAYLLLTTAEVMLVITCLEFSYTQAPKRMKSFVMSFFYLSISAGNLFTALVNQIIQNPDGTRNLEGAMYHLFFAGFMGLAALIFLIYMSYYREEHIIQDEAGSPGPLNEKNLPVQPEPGTI
ncbi:MAG: POT family MFS transporter [Gammaproteobacteria bacterium]|nr:POT family MFS transporter [Pseudomonadales bacterium]MCP5348962.1 POT family MFS transporter [Pseudomonadales bacterium]